MSLGKFVATLSLLATLSIFEVLLPSPGRAADVEPDDDGSATALIEQPGVLQQRLHDGDAVELPALAPNSSLLQLAEVTTGPSQSLSIFPDATDDEGNALAFVDTDESAALQPYATSASALSLDTVGLEPEGELSSLPLGSLADALTSSEIAGRVDGERSQQPTQSLAQAANAASPGLQLEKIDLGVSNIESSGDRDKLLINPVVYFRLRDRSRLRLTTGYEQFDDARASDTVLNYPVHLDWDKVLKPGTRLNVGGGLEFFDGRSDSGYFNLALIHNIPLRVDEAGKPLDNLRLSGTVNFSPLKANAFALENEMTRWFIQPRLVWRLGSRTRIINDLKLGFYSDGNNAFFADNRIIQDIPAGDIGTFSIGAKISNHTFADDLRGLRGYGTAQDFLAYELLLGWRGQIADPLTCNLGVDLGKRRVRGNFSDSSAYRAQCELDLPEQFTLQVGYRYSEFADADSSSDSQENTSRITARLSRRF